jgi:3-hydroxy-9,10-secoandrosta-1,3,5(10)-triene-9,17-dione monooxygenase
MAPLQKSWFAGPLVGTTRGALEEFVSRTRSRRGQIMGESVADKNAVQVETGESFAELDTAELLAAEMCARLGAAGRAGADFVGEDLLWLRRASAMVARLCSAATGRLAAGLGASGQVGNHPVYRLYRDCRMVASHVELNWQHCMGLTGRHALGIATGDPLIDGPVRSAVPGAVAAAPRRLDTQI